jgi:hypothetical protein
MPPPRGHHQNAERGALPVVPEVVAAGTVSPRYLAEVMRSQFQIASIPIAGARVPFCGAPQQSPNLGLLFLAQDRDHELI